MIKMVWKKAAALMFALCLILSITSQTATEVFAQEYNVNFDNGSWTVGSITVSANKTGVQSIQESDEITLTNFNAETMKVTVSASDGFSTTLSVADGKTKLSNKQADNLPNAELTFSVQAKNDSQGDGPEGEGPNQNNEGNENIKYTYDFVLNGKTFTDVDGSTNLSVPETFNFDKITNLYLTKIVVEEGSSTTTYTYDDNEYSYSLLDSEGRHILEANYNKISDNYASLRVKSHPNDIKDADIPSGKTKADFVSFYITDLKFAKPDFKGVRVSTTKMPDNYDFTQWNGVDLSVTTKENPGTVTAYYGENTIDFSSSVASGIKNIRLIENGTVPSNAVEIDNDGKKVKVLSNFYNKIPLEIELEDGSIGYVNVERIGIFIDRLNAGAKTFYHGASAGDVENMKVDTDKNRICAVFYHENSTTYQDYDLIVNLLFEDGTTETTIAQGVGDVQNQNDGDLVGSDYILWSGNDEEPIKVYVTAVAKDALNDPNAFGGAAFGSGSGVSWRNPIYTQEAQ